MLYRQLVVINKAYSSIEGYRTLIGGIETCILNILLPLGLESCIDGQNIAKQE